MFDPRKLKTISIRDRKSLVPTTDDVCEPAALSPEHAAGIDRLASRIIDARSRGEEVVLAMGGHAIKLQLGSYLSSMIREERWITAVAMNGAAAFHDMELAVFGETSEDVATELPAGRFGMADEPARLFNTCVYNAFSRNTSPGHELGSICMGSERSVLGAAFSRRVPVTIHPTIGADCVHMHPSAQGMAIGRCALQDFYEFCSLIQDAAVYINLGSAVTMPEVFLKAASIAINQGCDLSSLLTVNMDMIDHYRPRMNVIERLPGESIDIRDKHQNTIPALHRRLYEQGNISGPGRDAERS
jgi:hypothetical protein